MANDSRVSPGSVTAPLAACWSVNFTWNSGARPSLRAGLSALTSSSKGRS
jgi:hypothetical protein